MAGGVCKYFLEGRCRFGAQCRYKHPSDRGGRGGGNWSRGGRRQGDPPDTGRRWDQKGGNQYQLYSDFGGRGGGESYERRWDDRGQNSWRGRGGGRGGGWGGGQRSSNYGQSSNYQKQQYQNDKYHWSSRGQSSFNDNQRSNYRGSYGQQGGGRYGGYDGRQQATEVTQTTDPREIAAQIRVDMEEWSKSSMWPLSCYAYFRETPCLPGFTDVSPEELRWEAYQAKVSGKSEHYLKAVIQLQELQLKRIHECSNLTRDDVRDMLLDVTSSGGSGAHQGGGLFAPTTTGSTVSSLFESSSPPSSSLFGSQKPTGSSLFQSPPQTTTPATSSLFNQQPSQSLFGNVPSQQTVQTPPAATGSTGLGVQQSLVSPPQPPPPTTQHSTVQTSSDSATSNGQLTDKEMDAFKADKFTLGQIPEHAPPDLLCN